jgi:hypothetical protein
LPYCKKRLRIITRIKKQTDFSPPEWICTLQLCFMQNSR